MGILKHTKRHENDKSIFQFFSRRRRRRCVIVITVVVLWSWYYIVPIYDTRSYNTRLLRALKTATPPDAIIRHRRRRMEQLTRYTSFVRPPLRARLLFSSPLQALPSPRCDRHTTHINHSGYR